MSRWKLLIGSLGSIMALVSLTHCVSHCASFSLLNGAAETVSAETETVSGAASGGFVLSLRLGWKWLYKLS